MLRQRLVIFKNAPVCYTEITGYVSISHRWITAFGPLHIINDDITRRVGMPAR